MSRIHRSVAAGVLVGLLTLAGLFLAGGLTQASAQGEGFTGDSLDLSGLETSGPTPAAVDFVHVRIALVESELVEFEGLAQGAVDASARGDLDPAKANEVFLSALTHTRNSEDRIRRLNSMVSAGVPWGLEVAVFPVGDVSEFVNSWGFARSGGRRHKGTDILAPRGADLYAIEGGVIERQGDSQLGGLSVYLIGDSGTRYYYTHLNDLGPQAPGDHVSPGEIVGFVGDSGNARGTPHLHFQFAPDGKTGWENPYPLLAALWEAEYGTAPPAR